MREILFRGKSADSGEWVYGSFIPDLLEVYQGDTRLDGFIKPFGRTKEERQMTEVLRETVGQYTGLTDHNGKRIFEGDVVVVTRSGDEEYRWRCVVKDIRSIPREMLGSSVKSLEVIGNIYGNPELIEEGA